MSPPFAALQCPDLPHAAGWCHFEEPQATLDAHTPSEVPALLREAEASTRRGLHAVGWVAYEAAPAFDPFLEVRPSAGPFARFHLFRRRIAGLPFRPASPFRIHDLRPVWSEHDFHARVRTIRDAIARGETYQVNLTHALEGRLEGDPWSLFRAMRLGQAGRHQAYLAESDRILLSASPELFFEQRGRHVTCRPMKGTAPPACASQLAVSTKDRAENVMIVDMIRNDLGKLARPGSVGVPRLFSVEHYPTLAQMTSTITAEVGPSAADTFAALFPCASITGAPKRRTMEWIQRLEQAPRGVYCGAIGAFHPGGLAHFNVAIRTALLDPNTGHLRYPCGCGIVWDSDPAAEYAESLLKARVLTHPADDYSLVETWRWTPEEGAPFWPLHRDRLLRSAHDLGFPLLPAILDDHVQALHASQRAPARLRLLADPDGGLHSSSSPLPAPRPLRVVLDHQPTPSDDPRLRHKTTRRQPYTEALARHPGADDVLLLNERGELTEFCIGNLVLRLDGQDLTPPLASGLLPGVARRHELETGLLREAVLTPADLPRAEALFLLNATRGRCPVILSSGVPTRKAPPTTEPPAR